MAVEDPLYARRRIDQLTDQRLGAIEDQLNKLDGKVDTLSARLTFIAGGLALLSIIVNIIGPAIVNELLR